MMKCNYCDRRADDFDRIAGVFMASKLPTGEMDYTCPKCVRLIVLDYGIKKHEINELKVS